MTYEEASAEALYKDNQRFCRWCGDRVVLNAQQLRPEGGLYCDVEEAYPYGKLHQCLAKLVAQATQHVEA